MKKAVIFVLVLGLAGAGGYGVYHHFFENGSAEGERVSSTSEDAVYVDSVATITGYGSGNGLIERYGGEIEPQATLEVKLESDKKVKECFVKEGDEVREGQRLFVYETQEDEDNLAQAQIELERLEGEIEVSQKQIEQYEKEKKNANADDQIAITTSIMELQTSIKKSEYEIKTKKLEMERLKENIDNATVTSEMTGVVQKISDSGQSDSYSYGGSGESSAYITILQAGDFRVKGSANEQAVNQGIVYQGMPVVVHSRVDNEMTWNGTVTEVNTDNKEESDSNSYYYSMNGDSGSSSYAFYVELENSDNLILGQHVYIEENVGQDEKKDGLWLEEYYLMLEDDKAYVWRANGSNVLEKHEVALGEYDSEMMKYEITGGLDPEDYIAYPLDTLTEGAPVIYNDFSVPSMSDAMPDDLSGMEDGMDMEEGMDLGGMEEGMDMADMPDMESLDMNSVDSDTQDLGGEMFGMDEGGEFSGPEEVYDMDAESPDEYLEEE